MFVKESLSCLYQESFQKLSKSESILIEASIFAGVYNAFIALFKEYYGAYLKLIKMEFNREEDMIEANVLRLMIGDILASNEYTLEGIAYEFRMPLDAIVDVVSGINSNPSLILSTKIISLHADVRKDLYKALVKKVVEDAAS